MIRVSLVVLIFILLILGGCSSEEVITGKVSSVDYSKDKFGFTIREENKSFQVDLAMVRPSRFQDDITKQAAMRAYEILRTESDRKAKAIIIDSSDGGLASVGFVYIHDQDVATILLSEGLLKADSKTKYHDSEKYKEYLKAQQTAQKKKIGMWESIDERMLVR